MAFCLVFQVADPTLEAQDRVWLGLVSGRIGRFYHSILGHNKVTRTGEVVVGVMLSR